MLYYTVYTVESGQFNYAAVNVSVTITEIDTDSHTIMSSEMEIY